VTPDDSLLYAGTASKQLVTLDRRAPGVVSARPHDCIINSLYGSLPLLHLSPLVLAGFFVHPP
jgi:hypothetical protein